MNLLRLKQHNITYNTTTYKITTNEFYLAQPASVSNHPTVQFPLLPNDAVSEVDVRESSNFTCKYRVLMIFSTRLIGRSFDCNKPGCSAVPTDPVEDAGVPPP